WSGSGRAPCCPSCHDRPSCLGDRPHHDRPASEPCERQEPGGGGGGATGVRPAWPSPPTSASPLSVDLLDHDELGHLRQHAPDLRAVLLNHLVVQALQTKGPQGVPLVLLTADRRPDLADLEPAGHQALTSARARSILAGATCSTGRPRRAATCSGDSSIFSAATVAWTTLIGLDEPNDLDRTS